jgi:hypothetical protein
MKLDLCKLEYKRLRKKWRRKRENVKIELQKLKNNS